MTTSSSSPFSSSSTSPTSPMRPSLLFVWDYDRTIVLDDTDVAAIRTTAPEALPWLHDHDRIASNSWLGVVNDCLAEAARLGSSPKDIADAAATANLPSATAAALRRISASPHAASAITSDSNSFYIAASLRRHDLDTAFAAGVHTNVATIVPIHCLDGYNEASNTGTTVSPVPSRLKNQHQHQHQQDPPSHGALFIRGYAQTIPDARDPHGCRSCDPRLCKAEVVRKLRMDFPSVRRIVYVGDGGNDYCPVRKILTSQDAVLCRKGFPLERRILRNRVAARTYFWDCPGQLAALVDDILAEEESSVA